MAKRNIGVNHQLLDELRQLDRQAAIRFPHAGDPGFGRLGLIFDNRLGEHSYCWCTPENCLTFAGTGGDGTHFSFVAQNGAVTDRSPVAITIPCAGMGLTCIVGEDLFDFLCLGYYRGYFALEQLAYRLEWTLEVFTSPYWQPSESWHDSVGYTLDSHSTEVLQFLIKELKLRPWANAKRFQYLQERYEK